jgi:hypothetical protein
MKEKIKLVRLFKPSAEEEITNKGRTEWLHGNKQPLPQ